MKFSHGKNSDFFTGLKLEIQQYFEQNQTTRFADYSIWLKLIMIFSTYGLCYFGVYYFQSEPVFAQLCAIMMGLCGVMLVFNVVHDASHNAIAKSKKANQWLCYLGDLVGINTYIWDIRHNIQHHSFTNILGGDLIIENIPLIRLTPAAKWHGFHKLQIFYAPILYSLYSLYWTLGIDFKLFFKKEICNMRNITHAKKQWAILWGFKTFYVLYMLVFPILFTGFAWYQVLVGFLIMHFCSGILLSFVAVLGHFVPQTAFPKPNAENKIENSWSEHQLEATIDFSPKSKLINWITGGLNTHVAHHLFPEICHCHYYEITQIIENYCAKNNYPYKKETLGVALKSHFQYLKVLGEE